MRVELPQTTSRHKVARSTCLLLCGIVLLPLTFSNTLWQEVWSGVRSRAWDGTGHSSVARLYSQSAFPDTFGWTHSHFAGMPLPNFYPPFFYWLVALLEHTRLFSFETALKLVVVIPVLLTPAALWLLGYALAGRSRLTATVTALTGIALLADARFSAAFPAGLDYFSTFQIGLYSQPLGFVLLIAWFITYLRAHENRWRFMLAAVLLALTVLANFFNAVTAALFIAAILTQDGLRLGIALRNGDYRVLLHTLAAHLFVPIAALCLTLFWLIPMVTSYDFFVTKPSILRAAEMVTPAMWWLYAVALIGSLAWLRRPTPAAWTYLATCLVLALLVVFAATIAPDWFPLQSARFLATLNFLLVVPVGYALAGAVRGLAALLGETTRDGTLTLGRARFTTGTVIVLLLLTLTGSPGTRWAYAFYPKGEIADVDAVLRFARNHAQGSYLVEVVNPWNTRVAFDARAMNSYLGAQGNQVLTGVFHEASPTSLFTLPLTNAFSQYPDSFGVSSVISDDLDFAAQPLTDHLERARMMNARYFVIHTPQMKERLAKESEIAERHDFGEWSVFEIRGASPPHARALQYKPALVISDFTLKLRRRNEPNFIRWVEEQFAAGWFDVALARSPESNLDRLTDIESFGALVVDTYIYTDEDRAIQVLRDFSNTGTVILLQSENHLFRRISGARDEFKHLEIVGRESMSSGDKVDGLRPSFHYDGTPLRRQWQQIQGILSRSKTPVGANATVTSSFEQNAIRLDYDATTSTGKVPVLVATTYHPNWRRADEGAVYAATPFYMLTFIDKHAELKFERRWFDRAAVWTSAATLGGLCLFVGWGMRRRT